MKQYVGELVLRERAVRAFRRIVGIDPDPFVDLEGFLQTCHNKNPRFAGENDIVRFLLGKNTTEWPEDISDATMTMATTLQMIHGENPLMGQFDYVIAPGGARWSPYDRAAHAVLQVLRSKVLIKKAIIIAGSTRQLSDAEKSVVQGYAPGAETEYDLCCGAAKTLLDRYPEMTITTVCNPDPKSGNDGVIDKVMEEIKGGEGLRIGAVTTQIYHVGLSLDMARAHKRHGWFESATAGHSTTPWMQAERNDDIYFSECLNTLRKAAIAAAEGC